MNSDETNVAIVVPYIAQYSRRLFSDLHDELHGSGIKLHLLYGVPKGSQAERQDFISLPFAREVRTTYWDSILGVWDYKAISGYLRRERIQYVILEQAMRHLETYFEIFGSAFYGRRFAFWGHGYAHHREERGFPARIRSSITRRADWAFVYTIAGRERLIADGFSPTRITVVHNTIDTEALLDDLERVDAQSLHRYRESMDLTPGMTGLFLGGVDESKGIRELLALAIQVASQEPNFRLLIGGAGELSSLCINTASVHSCVKYLGKLHGEEKALALSSADFIIIPKRVGLVAVESIIAQLPLITQNVEGHGPELAYCKAFGNLRLSDPNFDSLLALVLNEVRQSPDHSKRHSNHENELDVSYEKMLLSLKNGILDWVEPDSNSIDSHH